jgi:hypothetical protein
MDSREVTVVSERRGKLETYCEGYHPLKKVGHPSPGAKREKVIDCFCRKITWCH